MKKTTFAAAALGFLVAFGTIGLAVLGALKQRPAQALVASPVMADSMTGSMSGTMAGTLGGRVDANRSHAADYGTNHGI